MDDRSHERQRLMGFDPHHQSLRDHPKTRKLSRELGIPVPTVIGHLHCLWWWAMDYAQDGDLSRYEVIDVAIGAGWDGDHWEFVTALEEAGFLDEDGNGNRSIHDWEDYAGKLLDRKRANAERMRKVRATHVQRTSTARDEHVRERVELPNQTIPNQTKQDQETITRDSRARDSVTPARPPEYTSEVDEFWQAYPKGHGTKKAAFDAWKGLRPDAEMIAAIAEGVEGWKKCERWRSGYVKDAHRWLRDRAWESIPPPQTTATARAPNGYVKDIGLTREELHAMARGEKP